MMVTGILGLWLAVSPAYGAAADEQPFVWPKPVVDWYATVKSPNYDKATAGDPHFDDKTLWPGVTGKELFVKQQWPAPKRVLIWAHPGESASNVKSSKGATHDPFAPASWRDAKGAPATEVVFDEETDLVFPSSETPLLREPEVGRVVSERAEKSVPPHDHRA
jgi:hypothetical protein